MKKARKTTPFNRSTKQAPTPAPGPVPNPRALSPLPFVPDDKFLVAFAVNAAAEYKEMRQVMARVACDDVEFVEYTERCSENFTKREAIKFALDAFGRRGIDPRTWDVSRTNDGWVFRDILNLNKGVLHISDRWTVYLLNKSIPIAPFLDVEQAKLKFEQEMAEMIFSIDLTPRQNDILAEMTRHPEGAGLQALANALRTSTKTISRAMTGAHGLVAKELVSPFQRDREFRLTKTGIYYAFKAAKRVAPF